MADFANFCRESALSQLYWKDYLGDQISPAADPHRRCSGHAVKPKTALLQIGRPNTGTTSIQRWLAHSQEHGSLAPVRYLLWWGDYNHQCEAGAGHTSQPVLATALTVSDHGVPRWQSPDALVFAHARAVPPPIVRREIEPPMRVLFVVRALEGGGAEFAAVQWSRYLAQAGDQVTLYAIHLTDGDAIPDGVSLVQAPAKVRGGRSFVLKTRYLARYLRRHPVDIIMANDIHNSLGSLIAVRGSFGRRPKVVINLHGLASNGSTGWKVAVVNWLARRLFRYADGIVAVSHSVAAEAVAFYGISADRANVVPNPALAKMQHRVAPPVDSEADPAHLDIAVPARLVPVKRPLLALDVAACLEPEFPGGVTVHYFGSGPLRDEIVQRAQELGMNAVLHGWVDKWFDECPAGAVVLLPSISEGFGTVLIEASAAGFRSVASSRCRGAADGIIPGITGELTVGDSSADFAAAVLVASRKEEVRGVEAWLQRFSFESSGRSLRGALLAAQDGSTACVDSAVSCREPSSTLR